MGDKAVPKLIDWMGGPSRVEELIERFYDAVLEDSLLEPLFRGMDSQHYLEWGSRLAVINSAPGVDVEEDQPMPKWGCGEVGGPCIAD